MLASHVVKIVIFIAMRKELNVLLFQESGRNTMASGVNVYKNPNDQKKGTKRMHPLLYSSRFYLKKKI